MSFGIEARRTNLSPDLAINSALRLCDQQTLNLIASFQRAVVDDLRRKTFRTVEAVGAVSLLVSGGVAANRELRIRFTAQASASGLPIVFPAPVLATDNAAMIAAAGWPKFLTKHFAPATLSASPSLSLGKDSRAAANPI
jgi:N6-L-threonylcarbamoyladenine synthase